MYKVFFKKFFGAKYEMVFIGLLTCFIMYIFSKNVAFPMTIDMFLLSNTILSVILSYQTITSNDNNESFRRLFTYPLDQDEFKIKYTSSVLIYSLFTRNIILFVIYCNLSGFNFRDFALFIINTISITLLMIALFLLKNDNKKSAYMLGFFELFFYLSIENLRVLLISYAINLIIAGVIIAKSDISLFMYVKNVKNKRFSTKHTTFLTYIVRYFTFNKSYILSWISLFIITYGISSFLFEDSPLEYIFFILIILIYNTPLSIVISSNKSLQDKIRSFPSKIRMFYSPYFLTIFLLNYFITTVFLAVNSISLDTLYGLIHLFICLQHAAMVVFLEYKFPVKKWNTETELWNNPRKYIPISLLFAEIALFYHFF